MGARKLPTHMPEEPWRKALRENSGPFVVVDIGEEPRTVSPSNPFGFGMPSVWVSLPVCKDELRSRSATEGIFFASR